EGAADLRRHRRDPGVADRPQPARHHAMTYETLVLEDEGPIARVWLNHPERHNALDARALEEIADVFTALQRRHDAAVVVLGGRGPSFCSGADRKDPPARLTRA